MGCFPHGVPKVKSRDIAEAMRFTIHIFSLTLPTVARLLSKLELGQILGVTDWGVHPIASLGRDARESPDVEAKNDQAPNYSQPCYP